MFRLIVLTQLEDGVDPRPMLEAIARLPDEVPWVRRVEVNGDLGLVPQAGVSAEVAWIAEFDDQAAWEAYAASAAHDELRALHRGRVKQQLVNMWATDTDS